MSDGDDPPTAEGESIPSSVDPDAPPNCPDATLNGALLDLEETLLDAAQTADQEDAPMLRYLFETWAHTVHITRADIDPRVDEALSLNEYLNLDAEEP